MNSTDAFLLTYPVLYAGLFAGQSQLSDDIATGLGNESTYHHAMIIDAGSSGTRVLAYKFRKPSTGNLELVEEHFEHSKPGLSSYADDPAKGAQTIVRLIKKAEYLTPPERRPAAPLVVRATAGLRLLPPEKAQRLIDHVRSAISQLGYDVPSNAVEIMDGSDEGIFIWYTVNLLHDVTEGETMAALDLGGGSTQITYQLDDEESKVTPANGQYQIPSGEKNITVYTHSYLNLGLLAARHGIFKREAGGNESENYTSECVDPIVQNEPWTYANKKYIISGASRPTNQTEDVTYERCHALVTRYVLATLDWKPTSPPRGNVAAMSYFHKIAADAGMIDLMRGGSVSVAQYRAAAVAACSAHNVEQPWACIDLVYAVTLLQDAYKIDDNKPISFYIMVNGHLVSWALGIAYAAITNRIAV